MHNTIQTVNKERDRFEHALLSKALTRDIPVLGICRGMQWLNVVGGGTLYTDIFQFLKDVCNHHQIARLDEIIHTISVLDGTLLREILGVSTLPVNSAHHQAVKDLASGFRISAVAEDGIIEAIESDHHRFAIGVQWHPESLFRFQEASQRLFEAFVDACEQRMASARAANR